MEGAKRERGTDRKIKSGEAREGGIFAVEYSPFPRKLRNVNRKIRAVSLYTGGGEGCVYERKERSGLLEENANKRGREGKKTRVYYTHASVFFEKVF